MFGNGRSRSLFTFYLQITERSLKAKGDFTETGSIDPTAFIPSCSTPLSKVYKVVVICIIPL
ncbi:MAG: hypothetical protein DHS20C20_12830 [Ardenticatenaceae bacterium]|nr:MAG: hypothetical protein DHS20C20_12830 [Ardenticatenaceae bacterium]